MHRTSSVPALFALSTVMSLSACAGVAELRPAENVKRFPDGAAYASVHDVSLRARGESWPGIPEVREHVTPVHITVLNANPEPILVEYGRFSLVGPGETFAAIPPDQVRGRYWVPDLPSYYVALPNQVTPPPRSGFEFGYDPLYDQSPTGMLPTREMLDLALQPGLVAPGGTASGFVYFERVPTSADGVTLTFDIRSAKGEPLGTVQIPFEVH